MRNQSFLEVPLLLLLLIRLLAFRLCRRRKTLFGTKLLHFCRRQPTFHSFFVLQFFLGRNLVRARVARFSISLAAARLKRVLIPQVLTLGARARIFGSDLFFFSRLSSPLVPSETLIELALPFLCRSAALFILLVRLELRPLPLFQHRIPKGRRTQLGPSLFIRKDALAWRLRLLVFQVVVEVVSIF